MTEQKMAVRPASYGLTVGTPAIRSVGPLAFTPDGILFVADNVSATIFALDVGAPETAVAPRAIDVDDLDTRLAAYLGCSREEVLIRDMAVHPVSSTIYLSVMRGSGEAAVPVLITVGADGELAEVSLENIPFAQTAIEHAPAQNDERKETRVVRGPREGEEIEPRPGFRLRIARDPLRTATVTDMAYVDGTLLVAGASNEEFSSSLRRIPFPFTGDAKMSALEIYHVSHGKYETASPIRTFVPHANNSSILASYTCTPVVHFSLSELTPGSKVSGRTVAELGAGNTPIDMVSFQRDGEEYLLVSNSRHPLMKLASRDLDRQEGLTEPREPVGAARETLSHQGVGRMANLNGSYVLMLQEDDAGNVNLRSYSTATL
jgi:hypothetical protein